MNTKHKICELIYLLVFIILVVSCSKTPTDYRSFLGESEKVYPAVISNIQVNPGNQRLLLTWRPNADPSITKYVVYWNNGADSSIVNATSHNSSDTVKAYINNLVEASYNFVIYSLDAKGNKSIPANVDNAKVYGTNYQNGLYNRLLNNLTYSNNLLTLNWKPADTVNVFTELKYNDNGGNSKTIFVSPDSSSTKISDWKEGEDILILSSYKPNSRAIDTFKVITATVLKGQEIFFKSLAGDYLCTGTLERQGNPIDNINESKTVTYEGLQTFKTILPFFNNTGLTLYLKVNADNSITILPNSGSEASINIVADGPCSFDPVLKKFYVKFIYYNASGLFRKGDIVYTKS